MHGSARAPAPPKARPNRPSFEPLHALYARGGRNRTDAAKLYGAIVAQARLPVFYQRLGVPDTLEGRFLVLSLHLFAVLHRLKAERAIRSSSRAGADRPLQRRHGDGAPGDRRRRSQHSEEDEGACRGERVLVGSPGACLPQRGRRPSPPFSPALCPGSNPERGCKPAACALSKEAVRQLEAQSVAALGVGEIGFPGTIPGRSWETIDMTQDVDGPVLSRPLKVDEIRDGASGEIAATDAEMEAIAGDARSRCARWTSSRLSFRSPRRRPPPPHRHPARQSHANLRRLPRSCRSAARGARRGGVLAGSADRGNRTGAPRNRGASGLVDWPEAIVDGRIDLGPVIYESLATALDPYPKREGAQLRLVARRAEAEGEGAGSGPFAALAALKRR